MPALQGTIALEEMDDVAVLVAEQLHLDVPRLFEVLLEEDAAILERGLGLLPRRLKAGHQADVVAGDAHAAAAAAGRRLDEHGIADLPGNLERLVFGGDQALRARNRAAPWRRERSSWPRSCCRACASRRAAGR